MAKKWVNEMCVIKDYSRSILIEVEIEMKHRVPTFSTPYPVQREMFRFCALHLFIFSSSLLLLLVSGRKSRSATKAFPTLVHELKNDSNKLLTTTPHQTMYNSLTRGLLIASSIVPILGSNKEHT